MRPAVRSRNFLIKGGDYILSDLRVVICGGIGVGRGTPHMLTEDGNMVSATRSLIFLENAALGLFAHIPDYPTCMATSEAHGIRRKLKIRYGHQEPEYFVEIQRIDFGLS